MAITAVYPDWHGASYEVDERGEKTAVAVVQVKTDDDTSGSVTPWKTILMDSRFPQRGTFFGQCGSSIGVADHDSELILWRIKADSDSATMAMKRLTLTYKSLALSVNDTDKNKDKGKGGNPKDPTEEAPEVEIDYVPYGRFPAFDIENKKLENSAHDPLEPVCITFLQRVIRITLQLSPDEFRKAQRLRDTVNAAPVTIGDIDIKAGAGRVGGFKASRKKKNGKVYYETTITILDRGSDPDGWTNAFLDVGCNYLSGKPPAGKSPIVANGIPFKLHGLTDGQPSLEPDVLRFKFYLEVNWNHFDIFNKEQAKG